MAGRADQRQVELKDAEQKLEDVEDELRDAQKKIDNLEYPEWYILTRDQNEGFASYKSDASRMGAIAKVFPWLFFFVAALVFLTSMTRMVGEERVYIGTYKALGFSQGKIAWKYILYALSASLVGSAIGIPLLMWFLPYVVVEAYGTMYIIESATVTPFHISNALISAGAACLCTIGATVMACYKSFMEVPAALMMPAAPKAGKRILLERIGFL